MQKDDTAQKGAAPIIFGQSGRRRGALELERRENTAWIGCHVSAGGGYYEACRSARAVDADCFALFLGPSQQWPFTQPSDQDVDDMQRGMSKFGYSADRILPHSGYFINLCAPDDEAHARSVARLRQELRACAKLGLRLLNVHPGSTLGQGTRADALRRAGLGVSEALADPDTGDTVVVLEMMAGSRNGTVVGCTLKDMSGIIAAVRPELRHRVGVCIDTCHCFAAGFDLTSPQSVDSFLQRFDEIVGLDRLLGLHLNDAREGLGSRLDRHADIGCGCIGLGGFQALVRHPAVRGRPMCLETPGAYAPQISVLRRLERGERVLQRECVYGVDGDHDDL